MLLRASSEMEGEGADLSAVTNGAAGSPSGVAHEAELIEFAEAVVGGDVDRIDAARLRLRTAVGPEAFVDAAGVVGNFQRMVRIADGTGIPLDGPMSALTQGLREDLGIDAFRSADNTPRPGAVAAAVGRLMSPLATRILRLVGRSSRG